MNTVSEKDYDVQYYRSIRSIRADVNDFSKKIFAKLIDDDNFNAKK